ncbi:NAD(P)/FAD-dependent oxidoreductase [Jannaschia formosa]|uniref:NAD(P)/FAD-dependent oxidoreductase n=1 Tax=Jannaschia formosa TaxID=2259592 RepID=UPI000E1B88CF|nr:FAD-dependent oxidoreductase [Jannaschia formosa]TFL20110.1 FAD-binding oxidoreductase [Jannaschia formosa]
METDFLVIGGGVAGVSVGAALSALGQVTLWEAEAQLGSHSSARSAAMFDESYGLPPVIALNRASRATHAANGDLSPRGLLLIGLAGEEAVFDADLSRMYLTEIPLAEARGHVPILSEAVTRTAYDPDAFDLDTDAMQQRALRVIRAAGGTVETGRPVTAMTRVAGGWQALSGDQAVTARQVVDAAGAWADRVAALAGVTPLGLRPLRRSVARIAAPAGSDPRGWPMLLGAGERWYAKPDAGALIVSPADETPSEPMDAWPEEIDLAEGLDRYGRAVTAAPTRPLASWAGLRSFTPDRCLALGPSEVAGFWWAAGQGGYGFQTAPAASRLLADLIAGRPPVLDPATVAACDPARLI